MVSYKSCGRAVGEWGACASAIGCTAVPCAQVLGFILLRNWWERVRTHLGLGEPLGLLVLLRHAHRGGLWMLSLVGVRGQRCGLVRCIERGAVDARVFRSAALARFIQSTWLSIFPGKVATEKGRTLLERPATPARRTLATRGATAPAKHMEDISLAFSTLVDDATSNGEGRSFTLAHSPLRSVDDPMAVVRAEISKYKHKPDKSNNRVNSVFDE